MKEQYENSLRQRLDGVPDGCFKIKEHREPGEEIKNTCGVSQLKSLETKTEGRGIIEIFTVFPGAEVSSHLYMADKVGFHHSPEDHILEINHCRRGRIGWNMKGDVSVYLGEGDICIHSTECCADSVMTLPLGYYEGITVSIDLFTVFEGLPKTARGGMAGERDLYERFCASARPMAVPGGERTKEIFSALYHAPQEQRLSYFRLKVQELLLYLSAFDPVKERVMDQYVSRQTELVKEIHDFITEHMDERFTIEELSKKYLINTSSLKSVFKAVYGQPIASYMKGCRIRKGMELLRDTDETIAAIAARVGYETQGKFTKAFKEELKILPSQYRRQTKRTV